VKKQRQEGATFRSSTERQCTWRRHADFDAAEADLSTPPSEHPGCRLRGTGQISVSCCGSTTVPTMLDISRGFAEGFLCCTLDVGWKGMCPSCTSMY
jgi:hypothetical protein